MGAQAFIYPLPSQKQMLLSGILGGQAGLRQEAVFLSLLPDDRTDVILLASTLTPDAHLRIPAPSRHSSPLDI